MSSSAAVQSRPYDVLVYGTICLDAVWRVDAIPAPGGYVDVLDERRMVGGEAANTAIALARWGLNVALAGNALGDDADGDTLRRLFVEQAPEIDLQYVVTEPGTETPYCLCMATPDGNRTMVGKGFAGVHSTPLSAALAGSATWFTAEPNAYAAGVAACLQAAAAGAKLLPMDFTRQTDLNSLSTVVVTSTDHIGSLPAPELVHYAERIHGESGAICIVTRGAAGCIVAAPGETRLVPAFAVPEIVDSTGAGDIFRAGLLFGFVKEWDLWRTIGFASAAAALNCGAMGGWGGVRSVSEIEQFRLSAVHNEVK